MTYGMYWTNGSGRNLQTVPQSTTRVYNRVSRARSES
jgi:hypothetical protein